MNLVFVMFLNSMLLMCCCVLVSVFSSFELVGVIVSCILCLLLGFVCLLIRLSFFSLLVLIVMNVLFRCRWLVRWLMVMMLLCDRWVIDMSNEYWMLVRLINELKLLCIDSRCVVNGSSLLIRWWNFVFVLLIR